MDSSAARLMRLALAGFFLLMPGSLASREAPKNRARMPRSAEGGNGGMVLVTGGSFPNGPCFRVAGHVTAPGFFDDLKRIDKGNDTIFRRGAETITHFPSELIVSFVIYDLPCSTQYEQMGTRAYLTRPLVDSLQVSIYWKRGIDLRSAGSVAPRHFATEPIMPYATALAHDLPEKFEWFYEYGVPSEGVPITDSLVLVLRLPDGHIAARVAARM